ncbi:hypothetical protein [Ancylobacter aquaticus]|uniref:hypothetical protein n=1 Tax=Ancylobacter aquaticus TaxID=100 RepID=UPI001049F331|nr:hypothetical protein [Ancylobacter aquaticus]
MEAPIADDGIYTDPLIVNSSRSNRQATSRPMSLSAGPTVDHLIHREAIAAGQWRANALSSTATG